MNTKTFSIKIITIFIVILGLFAGCFLFNFSNIPIANATVGWLTGWSYRKAITIDNTNNASGLTNYQVLLDTTNAIYNESGLVGSWHLSEGTGTLAADSSGENNNGTLVNSPTWTTGKYGGGLSFDGSNQTVSIPHSSSLSQYSESL